MSAIGYHLDTAIWAADINVIDWKHLQFLPAGQGDRAAHPFQVVPKTQNVVVYCKLHF